MAKEPKIVPFGKYELLEKIAVGGMAEIFKARTKGVGGFEKYLAIKRILPHLSENKDFIDMLINEAKIAVMLSHANIVQIYDLGKIDDSYFIAMEYIEGKDLRALMTRCDQIGMPLFIQHAIFIAIEVCKGLEYAHAKSDGGNPPRDLNIVHRDISPQNIMISYEGEVKLTDFGIAKANVNISETEAGVVKGKYEYMSPEQASGLPVDRRTDIFATGIVLYEMLTGQKPFKGESDLTILERVREAKVDPPSKYNKSIPKKLEKIVLKALAKEAPERYQTATELKDEMTRFFYSSTFNFTTSNLAAFMKSIFAEEIKLDVLTDADGNTGIGKRPDLGGDGNTVSRIFGKPTSDKFRKNGTSPTSAGGAVGAVNTDSNPTAAISRELTDPPSSSRTLGGEPLASIEDEINRILIPGKTNVGKVPTATNSSGESSHAPTVQGTAAEDALSESSAIPRDETGQRPTVATPRPNVGTGTGTGASILGDMQSAAMELAMEIEMAMPQPSRVGPPPRAMDNAGEEEEAATEAGQGMKWAGSDDRLEADSIDEPIDDPGPSRTRATDDGPGLADRERDRDSDADREQDRPTVAPDEARPALKVEVSDSPAARGTGTNGRDSTQVNGSRAAETDPGSARLSSTGTSSRATAAPATSPSTAKSKVPMRAVKERIRGVTVNMPNPSAEEPPAPRALSADSTASGSEAGTLAAPNPDPSPAPSSRGESTVIGRGPSTRGNSDGTEPGARQPSLSRTLNRPPEPLEEEPPRREPSRTARPARPDKDFLQPGDDYEPPMSAPPPRRNRAPVDEQADLYPAPGSAKRVAIHPAVLMLLGAIVFFAGVVLAKLM